MLLVSAAAIAGSYLVLFEEIHPDGFLEDSASETSLDIAGNEFRPLVFDEGRYEESSSVLVALENGEGILETDVMLRAAEKPLLRVTVRGMQPSLRMVLYWRVADRPGAVFGVPLQQTRDGSYWFNLQQSADWRGQITTVALGVYGETGHTPFYLDRMSFSPISASAVAATIWDEWTGLRGWSHRSINAIRGVMPTALQYPTPAFAACALIAALLLAVIARFIPIISSLGFAVVIMVPWLALDGLWQLELSTQLARTHYQFAGKSMPDKHRAGLSPDLYEYAQHLQQKVMPKVGTRVFLLEDTPRMTYRRLKLQYFLLPHNIYNYDRLPRLSSLREGDYILSLGEIPELLFDEGAGQLRWQSFKVPAVRLDSHPLGNVYRVGGATDD